MIGIGRVVIKGSESRRNLGKILRRWFFFLKLKDEKVKDEKLKDEKVKEEKLKDEKLKGGLFISGKLLEKGDIKD